MTRDLCASMRSRLPWPVWLAAGSLLLAGCARLEPRQAVQTDVVVYGCTSAGVVAAISAARQHRSVELLCADDHVGGMSSNGLGWSDVGNHRAIGGYALEFYRRVYQHYQQPSAWKFTAAPDPAANRFVSDGAQWVFEPHVAEAVFDAWLREARVQPRWHQRLDRSPGGVHMDGRRIVALRTLDGRLYRGRMFIDASYEGDLMAAAGVSYTVGRESNASYGEVLNGVQARYTLHHQIEADVDPYRIPGRPESGLLPFISAEKPGPDGSADKKVQAYTFRLCLTDVPANRAPITQPEGYDPMDHELMARYLAKGFNQVFRKFDRIPNGKTDVNNWGGVSFDAIGMNHGYPEGSYAERQAIVAAHRRYQQGLLWFLGNDPRVPASIQQEMRRWALCKDEFGANGNWPREIYVREARRMVSDFVMAEPHLFGAKATPEPVGMGSYWLDSHNVQRYVTERGFVRNEGNIEYPPGRAYPISYRSIVPRRGEAENLLVPVALSASHMAYGSIRMEPVYMILGQSAASAAALAIEQNRSVQSIDYADLRARLVAAGQILELQGR